MNDNTLNTYCHRVPISGHHPSRSQTICSTTHRAKTTNQHFKGLCKLEEWCLSYRSIKVLLASQVSSIASINASLLEESVLFTVFSGNLGEKMRCTTCRQFQSFLWNKLSTGVAEKYQKKCQKSGIHEELGWRKVTFEPTECKAKTVSWETLLRNIKLVEVDRRLGSWGSW